MAQTDLVTSPGPETPGTEPVPVCSHQSSDPCLHLESSNQLPLNNSPTMNANIISRPILKRTSQASSSQESCTMPSVPSVPATSNSLATPPNSSEGYQRNVRRRYDQELNHGTSSHSSAIGSASQSSSSHSSAIGSASQSSRDPAYPSSSRRPGNAINPSSNLNNANSSNTSPFRNHGDPWLPIESTETNNFSHGLMSTLNAIVSFRHSSVYYTWVSGESSSGMDFLHTSQSETTPRSGTITVNLLRGGTSQIGVMANQLYDPRRQMSSEGLPASGERIGDANRGLTEDEINHNLIKIAYCASNAIRDEMQNAESCVICLDEYADGEILGKLNCEHRFHFSCITNWLQIKNACPLCNASATTDASEEF